jgi:hypothetical protein
LPLCFELCHVIVVWAPWLCMHYMDPFLHKFIELLMVICRELEKVMEVMARNCCMLQIQEATSRSLLWVSFWTQYCLLMTQLYGFQIRKEVGIFTFEK